MWQIKTLCFHSCEAYGYLNWQNDRVLVNDEEPPTQKISWFFGYVIIYSHARKIISLIPKGLWTSNITGQWLMIRDTTQRVAWLFAHVIIRIHVTNIARHIFNLTKIVDTNLNRGQLIIRDHQSQSHNSLIIWLNVKLDKWQVFWF